MPSSATTPVRACPVCGDTHHDPLHEQRFLLPEGHPMADLYTVVSCGACGFVFADTTVDQKRFDAFYADLSKYQDTNTGTGGGGTAWDRNRLRDTALAITRVVDRHARLLDIGCANGGLLTELRTLGFERPTGVDPSPASMRKYRNAARYHEFLVAPFQDFNTEHINHFSARCLTNLLGRFGYRRFAGGTNRSPVPATA